MALCIFELGFPVPKIRYFKRAPLQEAVQIGYFALVTID